MIIFARMACKLNAWKFPDELRLLQPAAWESMSARDRYRCKRFRLAVWFCGLLCTDREVSMVWNMEHLGKTKEQWESWWNSDERKDINRILRR